MGRLALLRDRSPHFPVFPEFQGASYIQRYNLLCQRLVREQLYTTASVIASPRSAARDGVYVELDELTSLQTWTPPESLASGAHRAADDRWDALITVESAVAPALA